MLQQLEKLQKIKWSHFGLLTLKLLEVGQAFALGQVVRKHQIRLFTKKLFFSKHLVLLFDENDIYINQIFNIENVLQIDHRKMASHWVWNSNSRPQTWGCIHNYTLSCIYCFNKRLSINGSTKKNQNALLLISSCQASVTPFLKNRNCSPHIDVLFTDILTLNPAVSNRNGYNGNGHYVNTNLCLVCT